MSASEKIGEAFAAFASVLGIPVCLWFMSHAIATGARLVF